MNASMISSGQAAPDKNTSAKLCVILLIILLSLVACTHNHRRDDTTTGGEGTEVTTEVGYINNGLQKILVTRKIQGGGHRTLTKRVWGLDGKHFVEEEDYLTQRPDLVVDLLDGKTISFEGM